MAIDTSTPPQPGRAFSRFKPFIPASLVLLALVVVGQLVLRSAVSTGRPTAGVFRQTADGWTRAPALPGSPEDLRTTANGTVWTRTSFRGGLSRLTDGAWRHYDSSDFGTQDNYVWGGFAVDGERVWAVTKEGALSFDGERWRLWREAVKTEEACSIAASDGEAWVLDESGNLSHFANGLWQIAGPALPGVAWKQPFAFRRPALERVGGALWIVWDGLWRWDGRGWSAVGSLPKDVERAGSTAGRLWVKQKNQLWEFDSGGGLVRTLRPAGLGLPETTEFYAAIESGGRLLVSTSAGLSAFEAGAWKRLPLPADVASVRRFVAAADGTVWAIGGFHPAAPNRGRLVLIAMAGLFLLAALVALPYLFMKGARQKALDDRARMRSAVEHATGAVPENLRSDPAALQVSPGRLGLRALVGIVFAVALTFALFKYWPSAAPLGVLGGFLVWEAIGVIARSLQRRERKPSDPIGPGGPPKYDLGKSVKPILSGLLMLAVWFAIQGAPHWLKERWPVLLGLAIAVAAGLAWAALVMIADRALTQGRYDDALRFASVLSWTTAGRSYLRGTTLTEAGRYEQAERMLRQAIELSNNKVDRGMGLDDLGAVLMETGRFEEAQRCFEGAAGVYPTRCPSWMGRAELLLRQGIEPQKALEHAGTALKLFRGNALDRIGSGERLGAILATQAWALAACGRGAEAREVIEEALKSPARKTKGPLAQVRYKAGMALRALGDRSGASAHFARGGELDPAGRWGRLCAAALRQHSVWGGSGS